MFGQRVTSAERDFLSTVLKGDRLEQGKQFKAIRQTALRNNTSIQNAYILLENNKRKVTELNRQSASNNYLVDKNGILSVRKSDSKRLSAYTPLEADMLNISSKEKTEKKSYFAKITDAIKNTVKYIQELFAS